jgi:adenylosuccinate lyase
MATWTRLGHEDARDFRAHLLADPEVAGRVSASDIEAAMNPALHLAEIDFLFRRVFG